MIKVTSDTVIKEIPCKQSYLEKDLEFHSLVVKCKLTKEICCLFYITHSSTIGNYFISEDIKKCPAFKNKNNKKKKRRKIRNG